MELKNTLQFYKDKKVFITGHTGFKGSWLCVLLDLAGAQIYGYSLPAPDESLYNICDLDKKIISCYGDIRNKEKLEIFFKEANPEIVLHLAAQPLVLQGYKDPHETFETNVMGTVNILECLRKYSNNCSFLNVTTDKVYLNREWEWGYREYERLDGYDPYSNSKSCSELITGSYLRSFFLYRPSIQISTARAGNVIGGGDFAENRIIPDCVRAAISKNRILVRNPHSTRPYQHVLEPLFAYLMIAKQQSEDSHKAGSYNVGPGDEGCYSTAQLVEAFVKNWGNELEWYKPENLGNVPHEANFLKLDNTKIRQQLGWHPVWDLRKTIASIVEWTKCWQENKDMTNIMSKQIEDFINDAKKIHEYGKE